MRCNNCIHYDVCYQHDIIGEDDSEMCALYEQKRPHGEWVLEPTKSRSVDLYRCSICKASEEILKGGDMSMLRPYCRCGASMSANDRQVTGKLDENTQKHYGFRKKY